MSIFNIAAKSKEEQDKVIVEVVMRGQPEHLRNYFGEVEVLSGNVTSINKTI